jgi:tetratricopeptide (TPR) repeat protein
MRRQEVADACNEIMYRLQVERSVHRRRIGLTARSVGALERGEIRWPGADYREALRHLFDRSDADLGFFVVTSAGQAEYAPPEPAGGLVNAIHVGWLERPAHGAQPSAIRSPQLVNIANDPVTSQHLATAIDDARRQPDGSLVDFFRERLERSKADDGDLGPTRTLPLVLGTLGAIVHHLREVRPHVRRSLLALGADGAEFAGWLYRDLSDIPCAVYWYDRAMEWAQEADDTTMQAYVLLKKSQMAYDLHDHHRVTTFADAARRDSGRLPLRVRAEVTQQAALGMAMAGEPLSMIEQTSEDARELLMAALSGDDYDGAASVYFTADTLVLRQAACYTVAGKPAKAAALFAEVIAGGSLSRRDSGFFQARWAVALALSGEPDEAAAIGLNALALASQTDSERTKRVLANAVRAMKPWQFRPGPRELSEAMATPLS